MSGTDPKIPPVIIPQLQFVDANGKPYAGGSLLTLVPNTSTLKTTWQDPQQQAANTQPIVLDAAGRCLVWGDGDYQLVLSDAQGNQVSSFLATSLVSAAMYPVVTAPDIPTALAVLGITGMLDAETEARGAAITEEAETRRTFDEALAAEIEYIWDVDNTNTPPGGAAQQADAVLQANIDAERLRAEDAEAALAFGVGGTGWSQIGGDNLMQWGSGTTLSGFFNVAFPQPFTTCQSVVVTVADTTDIALGVLVPPPAPPATIIGFDVVIQNYTGIEAAFYWTAFGN